MVVSEKRLLVVEDDRALLDLLITRLSVAGYQVQFARDGHEAVRALVAPPDAMVLDLNMPGLDGFEVLSFMQRRNLTASCPLMVLTARHAQEDVQTCLRLGAKDYLAKPFSDQALLARVARLLRPRRAAPATGAHLI